MPAFDQLISCLEMTKTMLSNVKVNEDLLDDERYQYLFTVEMVNELVLKGVPFRDAYKEVGALVESGQFKFDGDLKHQHEGSLGNLCNEQIKLKLEKTIQAFNFKKIDQAYQNLLGRS